MLKLKSSVKGLVSQELESLQDGEVDDFFNHARKWDLAPALLKGGSIIFPHTLIRTCGDQVARAVQACFDSGARHVIALGVIHAFDHKHIISARMKEAAGEDVSKESCRGILGPLFPGDEAWKTEYSLMNFTFLWNYAIKQQRIKNPPELIHAYVCLTNNEPWNLPGIAQLKSYLPSSVVVATTDFCHHGVAYHVPEDEALMMSKEAEQFSKAIVEKGLEIIKTQNYSEYQKYSRTRTGISDGCDVGQLLMYLKGPLKSKIIDFRLVDTAHLFEGDPAPSWVVASLIQMEPLFIRTHS